VKRHLKGQKKVAWLWDIYQFLYAK
jgi:hypothetical protein